MGRKLPPIVAGAFGISIIGPGEFLSLEIAVDRTESELSNIAQPPLMMRNSALTPLGYGEKDGSGYCFRVVLGGWCSEGMVRKSRHSLG